MLLNIFAIVLGAVIVLKGADWMTDGAVALAQRMKISQLVIGLTVVAMGTSAPELFVSLMSALRGTTDMALGNVVGSNIFNTMLIVGVAAMVAPMTIARHTVRKDIPCAVAAALIMMLLAYDGSVSRRDAALFLLLFIGFMVYTVNISKKEADPMTPQTKEVKACSVLKALLLVLVGLACLAGGSNLFVDGASKVAVSLGISPAVVGLTIVAGGTSLPELATTVVAARKGRSAMAIGNVIGSNVFNILMILGITGIVKPLPMLDITQFDLSVMLGSVVLLWYFSFTRYKVERWEGAVLTLFFLAYLTFRVIA